MRCFLFCFVFVFLLLLLFFFVFFHSLHNVASRLDKRSCLLYQNEKRLWERAMCRPYKTSTVAFEKL